MGYKRAMIIPINCPFDGSSNPNSTTTYYTGAADFFTTVAGASKLYMPYNGVITGANLILYASGAGTAEDWTFNIRLNNSTDYIIDTVGSTTIPRVWHNVNLNIPVKTTDFIELKTTTPNWVTPPTSIKSNCMYVYLSI